MDCWLPPYLLADYFGNQGFWTFPKQCALIAPPEGTGQRGIK
jgi:hypothetical protein